MASATPTPHQSGSNWTFLGLPISSNLPFLTPDPEYKTPKESHSAPRSALGPRQTSAHFAYVRPEKPRLHRVRTLAYSDGFASKIGAPPFRELTDEQREEARQVLSGANVIGWSEEYTSKDTDNDRGDPPYPWAYAYAGHQFGHWAGQLGDGRAISLFQLQRPAKDGTEPGRFEIQLKGAGLTLFSRFADGKAVLRSSIREFIGSEYMAALGIPTTRALSLIATGEDVRRESFEPGAIVSRAAESWVRFGMFELASQRKGLKEWADHTTQTIPALSWDSLPPFPPQGRNVDREDAPELKITKYARLYAEIARLNARTVALWQCYGFVHGVLNTDNTSVMGLTLDYGPYGFLDSFDREYTPNHDDETGRYAYSNQPGIIWWNLVRLAEAMSAIMIDESCQSEMDTFSEQITQLVAAVAPEYKRVLTETYQETMEKRLGFLPARAPVSSTHSLLQGILDIMQAHKLDFHHFFRRLSSVKVAEIDKQGSPTVARRFLHSEKPDEEAVEKISNWLDQWRNEIEAAWKEKVDSGLPDGRISLMKSVNPNFVPRNWLLDDLIKKVTAEYQEQPVNNSPDALSKELSKVMALVSSPFKDKWDGPNAPSKEEQERLCGDVPTGKTLLQCSCSS